MQLRQSLPAVLAFEQTVSATCITTAPCSSSSFGLPNIENTTLLSLDAEPVHNYTARSLPVGSANLTLSTISFCNVSVTYTHAGTDDAVNVQVWLPLATSWNGRLQALGGGGYSASFGSLYMTHAVANGFIALDTDAGHPRGSEYAESPESWALLRPGQVNMHLLDLFGSYSLHEMAVIGKAVAASYYGTEPGYSYHLGCSGGGRQGMMIAQRYADDFDGILAVAPAINIERFITAAYWATQTMHDLSVAVPPCEIEAFTQAAIDACDVLDGAQDGVISSPELCSFDPHTIVGQNFSCDGDIRQYTEGAANVVRAAWSGPLHSNGNIGWWGLNKDASLTATVVPTCLDNSTCSETDLLSGWLRYFLVKDPEWDPSLLTNEQFFDYLNQSGHTYGPMLAADNPDLSAFQAAGGKLMIWHGLADEVIPPNGTLAYMEEVHKLIPRSEDFVRYYEAPGVGHCYGGPGAIPDDAFATLVSWVEDTKVPTTLSARDTAGRHRQLCPYPLQQVFLGGNISDHTSFGCVPRLQDGTAASEAPFYKGRMTS